MESTVVETDNVHVDASPAGITDAVKKPENEDEVQAVETIVSNVKFRLVRNPYWANLYSEF